MRKPPGRPCAAYACSIGPRILSLTTLLVVASNPGRVGAVKVPYHQVSFKGLPGAMVARHPYTLPGLTDPAFNLHWNALLPFAVMGAASRATGPVTTKGDGL